MLKVLVACEESQRVCSAFRQLGHEAYSCDIIEPSGGHPEWHVKGDVLKILNPYDNEIVFKTMDGEYHFIEKWDLIIAHPPCTFLTVTGNRWFNIEKYGDKAIKRYSEREKAAKFFMSFINAECEKIAVENPIGYMSTYYQKPTQIIQPFEYGHPARKATCLWLKGLPKLQPTNIVEPEIIKYKNGKGTDNPWHMNTMSLPKEERSKARSKTFEGIAKAMAEQWGGVPNHIKENFYKEIHMSENETPCFVPYPAEDQFMNCCCVDLEAEKRMKRDCYYFFDFPIFGTHIYMCRKTGLKISCTDCPKYLTIAEADRIIEKELGNKQIKRSNYETD